MSPKLHNSNFSTKTKVKSLDHAIARHIFQKRKNKRQSKIHDTINHPRYRDRSMFRNRSSSINLLTITNLDPRSSRFTHPVKIHRMHRKSRRFVRGESGQAWVTFDLEQKGNRSLFPSRVHDDSACFY